MDRRHRGAREGLHHEEVKVRLSTPDALRLRARARGLGIPAAVLARALIRSGLDAEAWAAPKRRP